jgi:pilus assembly protein CpaB
MRSRGLPMLLVAIIAGLMAVVLAARWVQRQGSGGSPVAVASQDIGLGTVITPDMLRLVQWPQGQEPAGAHAALAELQGRVITASLQRGEPVLDARLAPPGTKGGLVSLVAPGKRAMTVRVNDVVGVAGFALPGTFVDVLVSTQEDSRSGERERMISKIVLERMLVLAVAQEVDRDPTKPKVVNAVTLEVTPQQAEALDLARSVGTLSLVLRNQTEHVDVATEGVTKDDLLGTRRPPPDIPAPAPRPAAHPVRASRPVATAACIDIIRGPSKVTECF